LADLLAPVVLQAHAEFHILELLDVWPLSDLLVEGDEFWSAIGALVEKEAPVE